MFKLNTCCHIWKQSQGKAWVFNLLHVKHTQPIMPNLYKRIIDIRPFTFSSKVLVVDISSVILYSIVRQKMLVAPVYAESEEEHLSEMPR